MSLVLVVDMNQVETIPINEPGYTFVQSEGLLKVYKEK